MWKVNRQRTMDAKWWQKLILPLATWAKNAIWNVPLLRGHLPYKVTFSLSQRRPLNTGLTVTCKSCWEGFKLAVNSRVTVTAGFTVYNIESGCWLYTVNCQSIYVHFVTTYQGQTFIWEIMLYNKNVGIFSHTYAPLHMSHTCYITFKLFNIEKQTTNVCTNT